MEPSILQFKYPKTMGTIYTKEMKARQSPRQKQKPEKAEEDNEAVPSQKQSPRFKPELCRGKQMQINNIASLRESVRIPNEKPHILKTHYCGQFTDRKGTEEVGSLNKEGFHPEGFRAARPVGELER